MTLTATPLSLVRTTKLIVLHRVPFHAPSGALTVVLGPKGAGKTSLLGVLLGANRPQTGEVRLDDAPITPEQQLAMGFVPQGELVPASLRVARAIGYAAELRLSALSPEARRARMDHVIAQLQLDAHREARVDKLDALTRRRVSVAVELLSDPDILLLDAISPEDAILCEVLRERAHAPGKLVIAASTGLEPWAQADQLVVLCRGWLVYLGPPDQMSDAVSAEALSRAPSYAEAEALARAFEAHPLGRGSYGDA